MCVFEGKTHGSVYSVELAYAFASPVVMLIDVSPLTLFYKNAIHCDTCTVCYFDLTDIFKQSCPSVLFYFFVGLAVLLRSHYNFFLVM